MILLLVLLIRCCENLNVLKYFLHLRHILATNILARDISAQTFHHGYFMTKVLFTFPDFLLYQTFISVDVLAWRLFSITIFWNRDVSAREHFGMETFRHGILGHGYSLLSMRQLHSNKPKLDIGLFVDFCVFTCFYQFMHDVLIKLFCRSKNNFKSTSFKN